MLGGLLPGSGALVSLGACQHVLPGSGGGWLTLEEARGNSKPETRGVSPTAGRESRTASAVAGLRFAVRPVGLDVTWLSQVLQSCELSNVRAERAFLPWAGWCL